MKLGPKERKEVNRLIEQAQDDLEGVICKLVGEREKIISNIIDNTDSCKACVDTLLEGSTLHSHSEDCIYTRIGAVEDERDAVLAKLKQRTSARKPSIRQRYHQWEYPDGRGR